MSGKSIFIAGAVATALVVGGVYAVANLETDSCRLCRRQG